MKKHAANHPGPHPLRLFLGLDASTQGLKATLIDGHGRLQHETAVQFDVDLPEFKTQGGVHRQPDGLTVTAPPLMWVAALDLLLERMKHAKAPLARVAAISGSGQQHGSVYLKAGARAILHALNPRQSLKDQASGLGLFSVAESPVWMDSSTTPQCRQREAALGGPQATADLTGSRAYERFTGNQIAKIYQQHPDQYQATERIALVSSFMASLLIGDYAPIEPGDGAGMNLMDLRTKQWAQPALDCTAPDLEAKLGHIVPSHTPIGRISAYFVNRYGFSVDCEVIAFSGDNPCSLAALRLEQPGEIAVSLGTSDTVFGALADPRPSATEGHIFGNPINPAGYMALICYKNGSLTREFIRDEYAGGSWNCFNRALAETPPGNNGKLGLYFKEPEITPPVLKPGVFRFDADNPPVKNFTPAENIRAVVEGQFLSMRLHGQQIGLEPRMILATGGASVNAAILQIMADVFGCPVFTSRQPNSASLGAAYRALHGRQCARAGRYVPFKEAVPVVEPFCQAAAPNPGAAKVYAGLLTRYAALERQIAG